MTRPALRLLAGPCLLALALTGCSSSTKASDGVDATGPTPTATATSAAPTAAATSAAPGASARPGVSATASPTASATRPRSTASASTQPTAKTGTLGTAPGTYTYDTSGTVTVLGGTQDASGTTSFVVEALSGGSQRTTMSNDHSTTEERVVPRSTGLYLSYLHIAAPRAFDAEFQLSPAALLLPTPAKVGASWSWKATSTDGKTTATQSSKVLRTETLVIGGQKVATVVVQTHLVLTGGVDFTADVTNWVSETYRLVVKDHQVAKGTTSFGAAFSNDVTDVIRSVRPS